MIALRLSLALAAVALLAAFAFAAVAPNQAQAHRSRCHQAHTCPSDHATYRWYGRTRLAVKSIRGAGSLRRKVRAGPSQQTYTSLNMPSLRSARHEPDALRQRAGHM